MSDDGHRLTPLGPPHDLSPRRLFLGADHEFWLAHEPMVGAAANHGLSRDAMRYRSALLSGIRPWERNGAASFRQTRSDAVTLAAGTSLSCADLLKQATRTPACPVRDEEAAGSNPATPTTFSHLEARFHDTGAGFLDRLTAVVAREVTAGSRSRPLSRDRTRSPRCPASRCTTRCPRRQAVVARVPRRARPAVRIRPQVRPGALHPRAQCRPAHQDAADS